MTPLPRAFPEAYTHSITEHRLQRHQLQRIILMMTVFLMVILCHFSHETIRIELDLDFITAAMIPQAPSPHQRPQSSQAPPQGR